ncbi:uncharacterized protein LOC123677550 isoform X1 [Harmonia axyridis]|uniref:uncharacterized protein LOC123677550 isoform X1 n=1 Tax=Harmonia axyridis TaxID=115357 RepID=UPI001E2767B9|nr:uncharacterized protein LOC123677550 isoform X1 [Harmonia axyridis]
MSQRRCGVFTFGSRIFVIFSSYIRVVFRTISFEYFYYCFARYMNDDNNANNNAGYCGEQEPSEDKVIETVDLITNEVISFKENILSYQGRTYLLGDISYKWKKDCRMWLWKNRPSMKQEIGDLRNNQSINITTLA